jgi:hypothetical protein
MQYKEFKFDRNVIYDEVLAYIRDNRKKLVWYTNRRVDGIPPEMWVQSVTASGIDVKSFIEEVYQRLISAEKISTISISAHSSQTVAIQDSFSELHLENAIFEELMWFIRAGVVVQARVTNPDKRNWKCFLSPDADHILLTEYGVEFVENVQAMPYYSEEYFARLR